MPLNDAGEQRVALAARRDRAGRPWVRTRRGGSARARAYASVGRGRVRSSSACSFGSPSWPATSATKNGVPSASSPPQVAACCAQPSAWRRAATMPALHALRAARPRSSRSTRARARGAAAATSQSCSVSYAIRSKQRADLLHRAADDAQRAQLLAGVVQRDRELEPLGHHVGGDAVAVVGARRALERGERVAVELVACVARVGREVGELVLVAGDAGVGRRDRIERGVREHVLVRDLVHL